VKPGRTVLAKVCSNLTDQLNLTNLKMPYVYDCITKLCRTYAEITLNHGNPNIYGTGKGEAMHRKYKRLKLGGGQAYDHSAV
jgi:hypothetical protein